MTVWAEQPRDGGSAVWGCDQCSRGGWCSDHTSAFIEARLHADEHDEAVIIPGRGRGPEPDHDRDARIRCLRDRKHTIRQIAALVGISVAGVAKSLDRTR